MAMRVEDAADHRGQQLAMADQGRLGTREARARRVHGSADDEQQKRGRGSELCYAMLEHVRHCLGTTSMRKVHHTYRAATRHRRCVDCERYHEVGLPPKVAPATCQGVQSQAARMTDWVETTSIGTFKSDDLTKPGEVFRYNRYLYRTIGKHLSNGGMGAVYELERRDDATGAIEQVVGKVFHSNYLFQLRTDEITRRDHHNNLAAMARIAAIEHPNILPTYVSAPISDNYLFVTPRMGVTLLEALAKHNLTPRSRTKLLVQALEGLSTLHAARLIHRDRGVRLCFAI